MKITLRNVITPALTFFILLFTNCLASAGTASPINTIIEKAQTDNGATWAVSYTLDTPSERLVFVRNPDSSRVTRWLPINSDIEIVYNIAEQKEVVRSKTGKLISNVSFSLTPTYKHLGKDYAPFSPFSDGGNAFHSGRLFACANACTEEDNKWRLTLNVPSDEHIVLNGKVVKSSVSWSDNNDGRVVYVGKQQPIITDDVVALIDPGLPKSIKASLEEDIPNMMAFFSHSLNPLKGEKPMLFASYANVDDHSTQGGTLPNQIFMHWNRQDLNEQASNSNFVNQTLWFFAHEVAHFYQPGSTEGVSENEEQSWLHEGSADYFAAIAMNFLYEDTNSYVESRMTRAFESCTEGLAQTTLAHAYKNGQFNLYYSCGMIMHRAIDSVVQQKTFGEETLFTVWKRLQKAVHSGMPPGTATFLTLLEPYNAPELIKAINNATSDDAIKAIQGIETLYQLPE
ncbi:M1 family metallopeptidase [Alteromonas portus]|uniref:M1 family metallopeptidase n=1 Tax=Alteromonas portus TaxID=2565549 RepID=A0A4U0ZL79_9ALTE|nr:M1 family metallopeptidase [Alteromonas portus]TKB04562.1 M1 family metallopeptidase [Alteromonas portus]